VYPSASQWWDSKTSISEMINVKTQETTDITFYKYPSHLGWQPTINSQYDDVTAGMPIDIHFNLVSNPFNDHELFTNKLISYLYDGVPDQLTFAIGGDAPTFQNLTHRVNPDLISIGKMGSISRDATNFDDTYVYVYSFDAFENSKLEVKKCVHDETNTPSLFVKTLKYQKTTSPDDWRFKVAGYEYKNAVKADLSFPDQATPRLTVINPEITVDKNTETYHIGCRADSKRTCSIGEVLGGLSGNGSFANKNNGYTAWYIGPNNESNDTTQRFLYIEENYNLRQMTFGTPVSNLQNKLSVVPYFLLQGIADD
jgi:hypothetical protein